MYVPIEGKGPKGQPFAQFLHGTILPITASDPNLLFRPSGDLRFVLGRQTYEPDVAIRIGRTPLSPSDPSTYVDVSKYMEYSLRRYHSSTGGATNTNLYDKGPVAIPRNLTGVQPNGKGEVLPFGCQVNPLAADAFKPVHLIPGCLYKKVDYMVTPGSGVLRGGLFKKVKGGGNPATTTGPTAASVGSSTGKTQGTTKCSAFASLATPPHPLMKSSSPVISRANTADNYLRKVSTAAQFMVATHGRILNVFALPDSAKDFSLDPPLIKVTFANGVITSLDAFGYTGQNGEKVLDILLGFSTGEVIWVSAFSQRFAIFNRNGLMAKAPALACTWLAGGSFFAVGFANGECLVLNRTLDTPETYAPTAIKRKLPSEIIRHSLVDSKVGMAHYKLSNKPITAIAEHPLYHNILAIVSDDGYLRVCDLFTERVHELHPSNYGGLLCCTFTRDGRLLLVGGGDDTVTVYQLALTDTETLYRPIASLVGSNSWIKSITELTNASPSSPSTPYTFACLGDDGYYRVWELPRSSADLPKFPAVDPSMACSHALFRQQGLTLAALSPSQKVPLSAPERPPKIAPLFQFNLDLGKAVFCARDPRWLWIGLATGDLMRWRIT